MLNVSYLTLKNAVKTTWLFILVYWHQFWWEKNSIFLWGSPIGPSENLELVRNNFFIQIWKIVLNFITNSICIIKFMMFETTKKELNRLKVDWVMNFSVLTPFFQRFLNFFPNGHKINNVLHRTFIYCIYVVNVNTFEFSTFFTVLQNILSIVILIRQHIICHFKP